jgi:hypothetical protein
MQLQFHVIFFSHPATPRLHPMDDAFDYIFPNNSRSKDGKFHHILYREFMQSHNRTWCPDNHLDVNVWGKVWCYMYIVEI